MAKNITTNNNTSLPVENVVLASIDATIKTYQVREHDLNELHVQSLVWSDSAKWNNIVVRKLDETRYAIVAGFHRYEARKQQISNAAIEQFPDDTEKQQTAIDAAMQKITLKAYVAPSDMDNDTAMLLAYQSNSEHGLPLTTAEKKRYAVLVHLSQPELAHYKIAQMVHISDKTVTSAIEAYEAEIAKANQKQAESDGTDEDVETDEEIEVTIDFDARFKAFAKQVRKFYNEVIYEIDKDEDVATYLTRAFNKPASDSEETPYDGDIEVLKTMANSFTKAYRKVAPVQEKPAKKTAKPTNA